MRDKHKPIRNEWKKNLYGKFKCIFNFIAFYLHILIVYHSNGRRKEKCNENYDNFFSPICIYARNVSRLWLDTSWLVVLNVESAPELNIIETCIAKYANTNTSKHRVSTQRTFFVRQLIETKKKSANNVHTQQSSQIYVVWCDIALVRLFRLLEGFPCNSISAILWYAMRTTNFAFSRLFSFNLWHLLV